MFGGYLTIKNDPRALISIGPNDYLPPDLRRRFEELVKATGHQSIVYQVVPPYTALPIEPLMPGRFCMSFAAGFAHCIGLVYGADGVVISLDAQEDWSGFNRADLVDQRSPTGLFLNAVLSQSTQEFTDRHFDPDGYREPIRSFIYDCLQAGQLPFSVFVK